MLGVELATFFMKNVLVKQALIILVHLCGTAMSIKVK
jgi:hypothetical protein